MSVYAPSVWSAHLNDARVTVQMDNDILFGTDRQYTAGFNVYLTEGNMNSVDWLMSPVERLLSSGDAMEDAVWTTDQIEFGVHLYTLRQKPTKLHPDGVVGNSAWTYLNFRRFYRYDTRHFTMDWRFGWIGESNGGEAMQNGVHAIIGNSDVKGWDKQPPDQPTLQWAIEDQNVMYRSDETPEDGQFNFYRSLSATIGSPQTTLSAGLGMYYAVNAEPVFAYNRLNHLNVDQRDWGWFVFANAGLSYDVYNLYRDGRLFTDDKSDLEEANTFFPSAQYGGGLVYNEISFTLTGTSMGQFYQDQTENVFRFASFTVTFPI